MQKYFDRLKIAYNSVRTRKVTLQQRLMVYFLAIASGIMAALLLFFTATGMFSFSDRFIGQTLDFSLYTSTSQITEQFDNLTAHGIKLSKKLAREADYIMEKNGIDFENINNNSEIIESIQQSAFNPLLSTLEMSECSGTYFVLDSTVNTKTENSKKSRSGVYLRRTSLNDSNNSSDITLFRGMKAVARKNKLEMHNRWNMEFDIEKIPNYIRIAQDKKLQNPKAFIWSDKTVIFGTWEDAMLLAVPIISDSGKFYGVCGIEVSSLFFRLKYSSADSRYGTVVSAVSPVKDNVLELACGLCGADNKGKFSESPLKISFGKHFNIYKAENSSTPIGYMGVQKNIRLSSAEFGDGGPEWVSTVLLPISSYRDYVFHRKIVISLIIIVLMLALVALSFYLTERCVKPIKQRVMDIQDGNMEGGKSTGLSELDELLAFFYQSPDGTNKASPVTSNPDKQNPDVPQGIQEIFDSFIKRTERLTDAERNILGYYIDGNQIQDIPALAYISMSTVRKHNRSIYEKLEIASKDELMLYISMLKRCGRLDDIDYPQKNKKTDEN